MNFYTFPSRSIRENNLELNCKNTKTFYIIIIEDTLVIYIFFYLYIKDKIYISSNEFII